MMKCVICKKERPLNILGFCKECNDSYEDPSDLVEAMLLGMLEDTGELDDKAKEEIRDMITDAKKDIQTKTKIEKSLEESIRNSTPCYDCRDFDYSKPCAICNKELQNVKMKNTNETEMFKNVTNKLYETYRAKNSDYGNSFGKLFAKHGMTSTVIRLSDKLSRLESLTTKEQMVKDESIRDTLLDMANYCIMTVIELDKK